MGVAWVRATGRVGSIASARRTGKSLSQRAVRAEREGRARRSPVPEWVPADLPAAPGVYQFEAAGGTVLYVGKSINLKRRVRGYFYGGGPSNPRLAEMLALARAVRAQRTGSDLEARLEEAERIVAGRPRYNRALKNRARGWYLEIDWSDPFPRLRVVRAARRPRARYFGPYRGRALPERIARAAERIFRLRSCAGKIVPDANGSPCLAYGLDLCSAPCIRAARLDAYRRQVERAEALLSDPAAGTALARRLVERRDRASAAAEYERAGRRQRRRGGLAELEADRAALERPWVEGTWLGVLPHHRAGRAVLLPFVRGRVLSRRALAWGDPGWATAVEDACYAARVAALRAEPVLEPAELVPGLLVTAWLLDGAPEGLALDLDRLDDRTIVSRLVAARGTLAT